MNAEWLVWVSGLVGLVGLLAAVELGIAFLRWGADEGASE